MLFLNFRSTNKMSEWSAAEYGSLATALGAALVLLVKTCFGGMSESRCEKLRCMGCCDIQRKVKEPPIDNTPQP